MASTSTVEYTDIDVNGLVSVIQVGDVTTRYRDMVVLIMGPTGSGKSSFIEALGLQGTSRISSNGLDGFMQTISTYRLNNVTRDGDVIYLVDSPGFADSKISETSIVTMIQTWMKDNDTLFNHVLYFTPITPVRLSGTQQQVLKTFQALTGVDAAYNISIVTTMWDNIWGEGSATRAEKTYEQLQDDIWKNFIQQGAQITRFYNTKESALSILDNALGQGSGTNFSIEDHRRNIKEGPFAINLLTDLLNRIQNLHSHIPTLKDELAHAEAQGDDLLVSTLRPRLQEAENDLARFSEELDDSGFLPLSPPPLSATAGAYEASGTFPTGLSAQRSSTYSPIVAQDDDHLALTHIRKSSTTNAQSPLNMETLSTTRPAVQEDQPMPQQQLVPARRTPGRFVRILKMMKCWGDAVSEHHED